VRWSFTYVNAEAKTELDALPRDVRASFERIVGLVQAMGLERVHEPTSSTSKIVFGKCGCGAGMGSRARSM
jgi:hypothetical protein